MLKKIANISVCLMLVSAGFSLSCYGGEKNKRVYNSLEISPDIKGFGGPIELQLTLINGTIKKVRVISHDENPEYASGISSRDFLNQFVGKNSEDPLIVGQDIDAVTGATVSSKTVAETVRACLDRIDPAGNPGEGTDNGSDIILRLREKGLEPREAEFYKVIDE